MRLRIAAPSDAGALARLGEHSFVSKFGHLYRAEDLAGFLKQSHSEEKVSAEIADPAYRVLVAQDEAGQLIGFCKLILQCGWPDHARGTSAIELKQLYTDPHATGKGIGARLMQMAVAEATRAGADEIQLSVYSDNPRAQKFYAKHGFEKIADIHFMVGEQRDEEFLFARMLSPQDGAPPA